MSDIKHHIDGPDCPRCNFLAKQLHPTMYDCFYLVKARFPDRHISEAFRNQTSQDQAFADGKSWVKWPGSKHNKLDTQGCACSEAFDLFRQTAGEYFCIASEMEEVWNYIVQCGWADRTKWGVIKIINGKKVRKDRPHFEMTHNLVGQINEG